jgi:hypothetical protein
MSQVEDKRMAAIGIRRVLADLPIRKDVVVTTPEEIAERGGRHWDRATAGSARRRGLV